MDEAHDIINEALEEDKDALLSLYMHKVGLSKTNPSIAMKTLCEFSGIKSGNLRCLHLFPDSIASLFRGYMTAKVHIYVIDFYKAAREASGLSSIHISDSVSMDDETGTPAAVFVLLLAAVKDRIEKVVKKEGYRRGDSTQSAYASSEFVMYEHLKNITFFRVEKHKDLVDEVTLCSAMDLANSAGDYFTTFLLWKTFRNLRIPYSPRSFHAYMRSFRRPAQSPKLDLVIRLFPYLGIPLDMRTCDEIVNAQCRVGGLPAALNALGLVSFSSKQIGVSKRSKRSISRSVLTNLFIYFDKTWRNSNPERYLSVGSGSNISALMQFQSQSLMEQMELEPHVSDKSADFVTCRAEWATLCAAYITKNDSSKASSVLAAATHVVGSSDYSVLELSIASALGMGFPLLTSSAPKAYQFLDKSLQQVESQLFGGSSEASSAPPLSSLLARVPENLLLSTRNSRTTASLISIIDLIEISAILQGSLSVRASFIASLLSELLNKQLLAQAARVVRVLDKLSFLHSSDNIMVAEEAKALLARKWVAILLGSSLNKKKTSVLSDALRVLKETNKLGVVKNNTSN